MIWGKGIDLSNFTPDELGLTRLEYKAFRREQLEAVEFATSSTKRFVGLGMPGGCGKTLFALALAQATMDRAVFLTVTKGLQEQYMTSSEGTGMVDIRGKANYQCRDLRNTNCRIGPREGCRLSDGLGCSYKAAHNEAKFSRLVNTNYAYWTRANQFGEMGTALCQTLKDDETGDVEAVNPFGLLILDEAHLAVEQLSLSMRAALRESKLSQYDIDYPKEERDLPFWTEWANENLVIVQAKLALATEKIRGQEQAKRGLLRDSIRDLEEIEESMAKIGNMRPDDWVVEMRPGTTHGRVWDFDCVWPGMYAERYLFAGIKKVVLMSATLRPIQLKWLGIKAEDMDFREWGRVFPAENTPVYYWPALSKQVDKEGKPKPIKLNRNTSEEDWFEVVDDLDDFIEAWAVKGKMNGIVHTGSYSRQEIVLRMSRYSHLMIVNKSDPDSPSAIDTAERFRNTPAPAVLVSPSFSTGWDFPNPQAFWQFIIKIPYPATQTKVMMARASRDVRYVPNMAMQDMIQASFRATRRMTDRCTVIIKDGNLPWFMQQHGKALACPWWKFQTTFTMPKPKKTD